MKTDQDTVQKMKERISGDDLYPTGQCWMCNRQLKKETALFCDRECQKDFHGGG